MSKYKKYYLLGAFVLSLLTALGLANVVYSKKSNSYAKPDLKPISIDVENLSRLTSEEWKLGDKIKITGTLQNVGDAKAGSSVTALQWTSDNKTFDTPELNPQENYVVAYEIIWDQNTGGDHYFTLYVDYNSEIDESSDDEYPGANNSLIKTVNTGGNIITKISPTSGLPGTKLTIYGKNLGEDCSFKGSFYCWMNITIGNMVTSSDEILLWSDNKIEVIVPNSSSMAANIKLSYHYNTGDSWHDSSSITEYNISGPIFTVANKTDTKITSIEPTFGPIGTTLTIYGKNFKNGCFAKDARECESGIQFGGFILVSQDMLNYDVSWSDEKISIKIPRGAYTGNVAVWYNENYTEIYDVVGPVFTVTNSKVLTCVDTDKGKNYYTKGETYNKGAAVPFTDTCQTENILMEHWCGKDDRPAGASHTCPDGCENGACIDKDIIRIKEKAESITNNKFDEILAELKELRDIIKEQQVQIKYLTNLKQDVQKLSSQVENMINNFITYGVDDNTKKLGAGERAAVMHSYKSAFGKLPEKEDEFADAIKIANGRWPSKTNAEAETRAKSDFKTIYKREANMDNANDNAAITVMAYGLRQKAENRNLESEKAGIKIFKNIYGHTPKTTEEWNIMQAITYSGASR